MSGAEYVLYTIACKERSQARRLSRVIDEQSATPTVLDETRLDTRNPSLPGEGLRQPGLVGLASSSQATFLTRVCNDLIPMYLHMRTCLQCSSGNANHCSKQPILCSESDATRRGMTTSAKRNGLWAAELSATSMYSCQNRHLASDKKVQITMLFQQSTKPL